MRCPNCHRDDDRWIIRNDEVEHLPCAHRERSADMLDRVREGYGRT